MRTSFQITDKITNEKFSYITYKSIHGFVVTNFSVLTSDAKYIGSKISYLIRHKTNNYYHACSESVWDDPKTIKQNDWVIIKKYVKNDTFTNFL